MIFYLEFDNYSHIQEFLAAQLNFNILSFYQKNKTPFRKTKINKWQDLQTQSDVDNLLFLEEETGGDLENLLVDIGDLQFNKYVVDFLTRIENSFKNLFLFSLEKEKLLTEEKNCLKKSRIKIEKLKSDKLVRLALAREYSSIIDLKLNNSNLNYLAQNTVSAQEMVDRLDFLKLSELPENQIKSYFSTQTPLFMLPFSIQDLAKSSYTWYLNINSADEIQLGLNLLMTKIDAQKNQKNKTFLSKIKKTILNMDLETRTNTSVKPILQWKLLLWKLSKI
jgi:hypothetical protein